MCGERYENQAAAGRREREQKRRSRQRHNEREQRRWGPLFRALTFRPRRRIA